MATILLTWSRGDREYCRANFPDRPELPAERHAFIAGTDTFHGEMLCRDCAMTLDAEDYRGKRVHPDPFTSEPSW